MRKIFHSLFTIVILIACDQKSERTSQEDDLTGVDSAKLEMEFSDEKNNVSVYIGFLHKFYGQNDYYVDLYFKNNYSDATNKMLMDARLEVISQDVETRRTKLLDQAARSHLLTNGLDTVLVFNLDQIIVDTVCLTDFEYYEDMIESKFVATYKANLKDDEYIVVSLNAANEGVFNKSPDVFLDSAYLIKVLRLNRLAIENVYSFGVFTHKADTFMYVSFNDYQQNAQNFYLIKNGITVDEHAEDYVILELTPVPLATNSELLYISSDGVPETDNMWTSLVGIDLINNKFEFYSRGRLPYK